MSENTNNIIKDEDKFVKNTKADVPTKRGIVVVGCGDGGCNIAFEITQAIPGSKMLAYNTSLRSRDKINNPLWVGPSGEDGTGKDRTYSQSAFKNGSYKYLLEKVQVLMKEVKDLAYVLITTTTAGGTGGGMSPMAAKFLQDNLDVPVILIGVYPSKDEDSVAQYNAMMWQAEVTKFGIPHIIFDNDGVGSATVEAHDIVNKKIADVVKLITGDVFGNTNISMLDSRDLYMLLAHLGGRISLYLKAGRPAFGENIDDYLVNMIKESPQPEPTAVSGIGLLVKGPKDYIESIDTSLVKFMETFGFVTMKYLHLEESNDPYVGLICAKCGEPSGELRRMRQVYDDIESRRKAGDSILSGIIDGMSSPLDAGNKPTKVKTAGTDLSALEL